MVIVSILSKLFDECKFGILYVNDVDWIEFCIILYSKVK